ncbi:peptidylprolyl isomerase [Roseomonas sp. CCTCC AB2023176]|uniref:peptidylprolyl isomerase n=1 Tax=Roseomonas sp. CCTCC AB2023176 TaxID=3342640 RepID=UPI0035E1B808
MKVRLDRQGNDESGRPVAIPGGAVVRQATLTAIFAPTPPRGGRLAEVPGGFMAMEVTNTVPAQLKPFEAVQADVRRWWLIDQQRRAQEGRAAALLAAAQGGKDFAEAAREAGLGDPVRMGPSPRVAPERGPQPQGGLPRELLPALFGARVGEVTMAETSYGFAVARLVEVVPANLDAEPAALTEVRNDVQRLMQDDLDQQYAVALRARANVTINQPLMEQVATR